MKVLILGGGGTLGAFSAGALQALEEHRFVPDVMIGSSAGGINMLRYLVGGAGEATSFWCSVARMRTVVRGLIHGRNFTEGLLNARWFRARVEQGVDFDRMMRDKRNLAFLVVDMKTGKVVEFVDAEIEALQEAIAKRLGYRLVDHRLELYGVPVTD